MHARKVALVTGANKGIGFEIVRRLAAEGFTVVLGSRDPERGDAAAARLWDDGLDVHPVRLDVTDPETVAALPGFLEERFGRLDVLVNNAAVLLDEQARPSELSVDVLRQTFEANVFGAFAVTRAVLPLLRRAEAGRIVNVSSSAGSLAASANAADDGFNVLAYKSSKAALNMITVSLANDLRDTPIKVNSACPGWVKTDMGTDAAPLTPAEGADTPAWLATLPADGPTGGFFRERRPVPW